MVLNTGPQGKSLNNLYDLIGTQLSPSTEIFFKPNQIMLFRPRILKKRPSFPSLRGGGKVWNRPEAIDAEPMCRRENGQTLK